MFVVYITKLASYIRLSTLGHLIKRITLELTSFLTPDLTPELTPEITPNYVN